MKFLKQKIKGVYIIKPNLFKDKRGVFRRHFCKNTFKKNKLSNYVLQSNLSENFAKGTLRGFHYQEAPYGEDKTMSCISGSIYDIVCDVRPNSKTFGKWIGFEINDSNRYSIHIPKGCANAFLTLKNNTIVHYYCSQNYNPKKEKCIRFNDPAFKFKWPIKPKIISTKDKNHENFSF